MALISLVTALSARDLDEDLAPLARALESEGAEVAIASWDDPAVDWGSFDAAVLRSAWDYHERPREFLSWASRVADVTRLINPLRIVEWNSDKRYLSDLAAAGAATVPTCFAAGPNEITWPDAPEVVIKPHVSAGSKNTARFPASDRAGALDLAEAIWAGGRQVMIQPYVPSVDLAGEKALVYFGGAFSHAFRKGPILQAGTSPTDDLFAAEVIDPAVASAEEAAVAEHALAVAGAMTGETAVYARVDVVDLDSPAILELELIEPSVYHHTSPDSAASFAAAILRRL